MIVQLDISNDMLTNLLSRSDEAGMSVDDVLDELLREAFDQPRAEVVDLQLALDSSMSAVRELSSGSTFMLENVIDQDLWDAMSVGDRKSFGKRFRKEAEGAGIAQWKDRTSGNKAIYLRT